MSVWIALVPLAVAAMPAHAAPALAWGAEPRYPADFSHFDYVNPDAPRGGSVNRDGFGSFDKLNPFTLRGIAGAGLGELMFETLGDQSWDEPFSVYGLLAEDMDFAADQLSITFRLNPAAKFWNGDAVLAEDVRHSFDMLTSKLAHPRYSQYFADVGRVTVVSEREVRFDFKQRNQELHLILATGLPIFSRKWGDGLPFDQVALQEPITSGPYRLESVNFGKEIRFRRLPDYWGEKLPVRRGMFNFERMTFKYFKDETARLEGFKAGEYDWIYENSAKNWARGHNGRRYSSGELIKKSFPHSNVAGMQGFAMNMRRPLFQDMRVRKALTLAFDFEWMNRQVFFGQYTRTASYFANSPMAAQGKPEGAELALLDSLKEPLDPAVFGEVPLPPVTTAPASLRDNLRQALVLLKEAGWEVREDGKLRNAAGDPFHFEVLSYSAALERIAVPWVRNLGRLGIGVSLRTTDPALFQRRLDTFDFDVTTHSFAMSSTPGNELFQMFSTGAADQHGSENMPGIRNPVLEEIIDRLVRSRSRPELEAAARALDRVLRHGWYLVPHFHLATHRVASADHLAYPEKLPTYYAAQPWMSRTWWIKP
ncbi:MAG: ABC transporter substrate-binding protein [Lautropia sp.]|nr:ABC transporter substrate-binding protein [Lautropia sp.]